MPTELNKGVSIVVPVRGIENFSAETLENAFRKTCRCGSDAQYARAASRTDMSRAQCSYLPMRERSSSSEYGPPTPK